MDRHARWTTYLKAAKNGHDRPLDGSRTKRVISGPGDSVRLRLHATDVVTLHADGTETITTNGWNTVTTSRFLHEHSKARVWSEKGQWYVGVRDPEITPPRVSKCRRCKDGYQPSTCHGPSYCYWRERCDRAHDESGRRHTECEHGQTARHALPPVECWQCHGAGRFDYGSNPVHLAWDGKPLTIDADGYAVGPAVPVWASEPKYNHAPAPKKYTAPAPVGSSYSDSGRLLASALPGLRTRMACPHCAMAGLVLEEVIIHLNDTARWPREQVADWLDSLDIDLTFPTPDEIPAHIR